MVDLHRELLATAEADLSGYGVTDWPGHVRKAKVRRSDRFFEFDDDGEMEIILPVMEGGELDDLVCFHPSRPRDVGRRVDGPCMLGGDNIVAATIPIVVHPDPLSWLCGDGVFVLNWTLARPILRALDTLVIFDDAFRKEVAEKLKMPPHMPRLTNEPTYV